MSLIDQWMGYPAFRDRLLSMIGIEIHWAILQYVIGLSFMALVAYIVYLRTNDYKWERLSRALVKGFVIVFAVGAATGTASEFGLLLLWPNFLEAAGRYFYFPFYAEVFAFVTEVLFVYLLYYTWGKVAKRTTAALILAVVIGAWLSAAMIIGINSYMVAPTGIQPAYDVEDGRWLYDRGYPRITLAIPREIMMYINITALQADGVDLTLTEWGAIAQLPVGLVSSLAYQSWAGYSVSDSLLRGYLVKDTPEEFSSLPVKEAFDAILVESVRHNGVASIVFRSPVYLGSILHAIGSSVTVSSFTVMAAYALRILKSGEGDEREYYRSALRFAVLFALASITIQGFVIGHMMGVDIAKYNPEKFAAMEATTENITSVTSLLPGGERIPALLAYGSPDAKLPVYDEIPKDYCVAQDESEYGTARINDCRPPLIIHYLYYGKITLGIIVGLYAAAVTAYNIFPKSGLLRRLNIYGALLKVAPVSVVAVHIVSFLGWAVREIGRKPWTIYGLMTTDVVHTSNPPSPVIVTAIALFLTGIVAVLLYSVWKFLWQAGEVARR